MILIAYDGSSDARSAIQAAGKLTPARPVTVLTVWEPFIMVYARAGGGFGYGGAIDDVDEIDRRTEQAARETADEGVALANAAGLSAVPLTATRTSAIADAILAEADALEAEAIVMGSRGLTGVKSILLGSVSHAVIQHADLPVVVVPSAEVAERRTAHRAETHVAGPTAPGTTPA